VRSSRRTIVVIFTVRERNPAQLARSILSSTIAVLGPVDVPSLAPWLRTSGVPTANLPRGRPATSVTRLVDGLLQHTSCSLAVITLDFAVSRPATIRSDRLIVRVCPLRRRHRARDMFRAERTFMQEALEELSPALVHANWTYEYALAALAYGGTSLLTVRDWAPTILRHDRTPYRAARLIMNIKAISRAPNLVASSPYIAERLERWKRRSIDFIPGGIDDGLFFPRQREDTPKLREILAVNNGFSRFKNVGNLLRAYSRVRASLEETRLRLVGTGYEPNGTAQIWARSRGLDEGVIFHGSASQAELVTLYRRAALLVHPSREESFGNVLVEAMSQGLPVIGGRDSGAVPWVLGFGQAGRLVDVSSPVAISDAICEILADDSEWRRLSDSGYLRSHREFRSSVTSGRYADIYLSLIEGR
jgi:L-malate glycosyltransferase